MRECAIFGYIYSVVKDAEIKRKNWWFWKLMFRLLFLQQMMFYLNHKNRDQNNPYFENHIGVW